MSSFDAMIERYRQARVRGTQADLDAVFAEVPDEQMEAFLDRLEQDVEVEPLATDPQRLHRELGQRGFDDGDAREIVALASAGMAEALRARMAGEQLDEQGVAERVVDHVPALGERHVARVRRYVQRLLDGRHDPARVSAAGVEALAAALRMHQSTLEQLRERMAATGGAAGLASAAARGDNDGIDLLAGGDEDEVDALFNVAEGPRG